MHYVFSLFAFPLTKLVLRFTIKNDAKNTHQNANSQSVT